MKRTVLAILTAALLFSCAPTAEKKMETAFFPPLPQQPRLQFLTSITGEEDVGKKPSAVKEWLIGKRPSMKQIGRPYDMGSAKGKIYISDSTYNKVLIIDLEKKEFDYIKDEGEGALMQPVGIWVTEDDIKYVADDGRKQIVVFDQDNKFLRAYGEKDQFERPIDVAVYRNRIYVVDFKKYAVAVLDKESGKTVQTIGGQGEFYKPSHVIVDREGNIYVNDSFDFRIMKFDPEGKYLKNFGAAGDGIGSFARPRGIAIDRERHLYVLDAAFENAQIFDDETTNVLLFFGGFGPHQGSMYLPAGLYIDYDNVGYFNRYADKNFRLKYLVYVGNLLGDHKLNVYGFGEWIGPPLPEILRKPQASEPDQKKEENDGKK